MNDKPISDFGRAPIKMEGGISDPGEWDFQCPCEDCKKLRKECYAKYEAQQKKLRGEA